MAIAFAISVLLIVAGCGADEGGDRSSAITSLPSSEDPGPIHVHGLAVDPADGALFVAAHTGLFRLHQGAEDPERVADRYQDTMAFTVIGPGHFLGSGHPDGREDLPPFLGLIESTNAGESWQQVSLMGQVDFHLLAAEGEWIYGFGSEWEGMEPLFLASEDRGRTWVKRAVPGPLIGLALSPGNPRVLLASTATALYRSRDAGKGWSRMPGSPGLLAWPRVDQLYLADGTGAVKVSADEGRAWRTAGRLPDVPAAFADGGGRLLAALHDGTILESSDDGSTWRPRLRP
ncbi:MAG: exo-alpha-sialidase [Thermoleophilia bacterium]|nr:exo-alpha-sialidase [Thermoleophilia bacterium]